MLRTAIDGAVFVIMTKVKWLVGLDQLTASPARHGAGQYLGDERTT